MRSPAFVLALLGGCHAAEYVPPAWDPPPRAVVDVGCVQLAPALLTGGVGKVPGIPLAISFHSDCKEPTRLDLRNLRVTARLLGGSVLELVPYDPRGELRAGLLAPGDTSDEAIEYDAREGSVDGWMLACVDFERVLPDRRPRGRLPVCFTRQAALIDPDALGGLDAPVDADADAGAP